MEMSRKSPLRFRLASPSTIFILAVITAAIALLPACVSTPSVLSTGVGSLQGATLQAIQITPSTSIISIGESRQLTAVGIYTNGSVFNMTSQVAWSTAPGSSATSNNVSVTSNGVATGEALGGGVVTATYGSVVGLLQLVVDTNGYSSTTIGILSVPYKNSVVDAAYLAQSQSMTQGAYAVQEVNLDADQFSSSIPVPAALLASIPMPAGFVPNATVANPLNLQVAVLSYSSPDVQIIDASNLSTDLSNNTIVATFTAPISKTVTFNGVTCMICAAVLNPETNQLLLNTAQGYYTMDFSSGTFTALSFTTTAFPSPSFSLNPIAANPFILSPTYGQDPAFPGEVQVLNLTTNAVTTNSFGLTAPNAAAIDLFTNYSAIVDAATNDQALVNVTNPQSPASTLASNISLCAGQPDNLNMVALGVSANINPLATAHTLFVSQNLGNCVGFEIWPNLPSSSPLDPSSVLYGYGSMPATPDENPFVNGTDSNAITTFTSVVDKNNYGLLVDGNQNWIAKINFATVLSRANIAPGNGNPPLPVGEPLPPIALRAGFGGDPVIFLPTPASVVTLSQTNLNFGNQPVGTTSGQSTIILTNVGASTLSISQFALQGTDPGDFAFGDNCSSLLPHQNCAINVTFTPAATGQRSAVLSITDNGGASPQTVSLSGTGT
jgi:hypothetical protein